MAKGNYRLAEKEPACRKSVLARSDHESRVAALLDACTNNQLNCLIATYWPTLLDRPCRGYLQSATLPRVDLVEALLKVIFRTNRHITIDTVFTPAAAANLKQQLADAKMAAKARFLALAGPTPADKKESELSIRGYFNRVVQGCVAREWSHKDEDVQQEWEEELSGWGLGEWQENPKCRKCRQTTTTISLQNKIKDRNAHECWPTNASIDRIIPASADGSYGPKDNRQLLCNGCQHLKLDHGNDEADGIVE